MVVLYQVIPTATTDDSLRIINAEAGFRDTLVRCGMLHVETGDSLLPVIRHDAGDDGAYLQELRKLLTKSRSLSVQLEPAAGAVNREADTDCLEMSGHLIIASVSASQWLVTIVADAPPANALRDDCGDSEAQLAKLASRLQAVLSSAVELDSSIHDTEMIYRAAFENLSAAIPFDTGSIQILHEDELTIVSCTGFSAHNTVMGLQFPLDDRFPNYYVITGKTPLALDDIRVDFPHFLTNEGEFGSGHIRTWLGVPLLDRGQVIGMITMDRTAVRPFDPDEIELAQALANHAAVALSNARMYESLQHANELQYMLLRELHHRVKNNLQLVSSLLNLRSMDVDESATRLIGELRTHIQALAASHDNIFQPGLSEDVMLQSYVDDIARAIEVGYVPSNSAIRIVRDVPESAHCGMDLAVPLGLITSELILNAVKHAFPADTDGVITVTVTWEANHLTLVVEDNGAGFPSDLENHHGFGLTLVSTLSQQMEATLHRETSPDTGTRWTIDVIQAQFDAQPDVIR